MITNLDKEDLIRFENRVADTFNEAKIKAPVHLYSNNEEQMIEVFTMVAIMVVLILPK